MKLMKLKELTQMVEHLFPVEWALPEDPVGLHVGDPEQKIKKVYVGLEASTDFIQNAIEKKAELVLVPSSTDLPSNQPGS